MLDRDVFLLVVRQVLDPLFPDRAGFQFVKNGYVRELRTLIRQSIAFDLMPPNEDVFRVTLGLNCRLVSDLLPADESGAYFIQWLTKSGVADFPRNWSCHNMATALRSLNKISGMVEDHVEPWLRRHQTIADFAGLLASGYEDVREVLLETVGKKPQRPP
jgi:hypothetical protein